MSEKQAKLNRKQQAVPTTLYQITISLMSNSSVNVNGFPMDWELTNQILNDARRAIDLHFLKSAREGRLNDQNVIDGGRILVAEKRIVGVG